jgi:hypothetical protein
MKLLPVCLLLTMGMAAETPATIFYSKNFPGSMPAYAELHIERSGDVVYREAADDPAPGKLRLQPEEAAEIFALADKLDHFQKPLESGLPVAKMGEKTYRWTQGSTVHETKFNYSIVPDAKTLQDWFERIVETQMLLFDLQRTVKFDRLGVDRSLLLVESAWDRRRLVSLDTFKALLNRVAKNDAYLNRARERAAFLLETFAAPRPPAPEKATQ